MDEWANMTWVKLDSWHAARPEKIGSKHLTWCGEEIPQDAPTSETLPSESSCELCLRSYTRHMDVEDSAE